MSEYVEVPFEGQARDRATLLLAAAEELGVGQESIQTRTGAFYAPTEVVEKAGLATSKSDAEEGDSEEKPKPRKRTAKKSTSSDNQE